MENRLKKYICRRSKVKSQRSIPDFRPWTFDLRQMILYFIHRFSFPERRLSPLALLYISLASLASLASLVGLASQHDKNKRFTLKA